MTTTSINSTMTTGAALRALVALCALLTVRAACSTRKTATTATRATLHAMRCAWHWLTTTHDFGDEEGPIRMTGWQYLGFGCGVMAFALLLCLDFDALWV